MLMNLPQLSRVACLMDQHAVDLVRVDPTPFHQIDGTVVAKLAGELYVIDRAGRVERMGVAA